MKYDIVHGATLAELVERVNNLLALGWKLQGGVTSVTYDGKTTFIQAIVSR
jgi:hypothetical protein